MGISRLRGWKDSDGTKWHTSLLPRERLARNVVVAIERRDTTYLCRWNVISRRVEHRLLDTDPLHGLYRRMPTWRYQPGRLVQQLQQPAHHSRLQLWHRSSDDGRFAVQRRVTIDRRLSEYGRNIGHHRRCERYARRNLWHIRRNNRKHWRSVPGAAVRPTGSGLCVYRQIDVAERLSRLSHLLTCRGRERYSYWRRHERDPRRNVRYVWRNTGRHCRILPLGMPRSRLPLAGMV